MTQGYDGSVQELFGRPCKSYHEFTEALSGGDWLDETIQMD